MDQKKQQKKQWQSEKEQLKADLDNRQKVVKKREVSISFGKQKQAKKNQQKADNKTDALSEHIMRQNLGLH